MPSGVAGRVERQTAHRIRRKIMGPIKGAGGRQTSPYLLWQEKLAERAAEKAKTKEADAKAEGIQGVKQAADEKESGSVKEAANTPVRRTRDEYVPGGGRAPDGGKSPDSDQLSEDGGPPDTGRSPEGNQSSKKAEGGKPEVCRASTDKVDREIEKLKNRKRELEGKLRTEKDGQKLEKLERELAQVERELSRKDNDTYRRQHMEVTKL